jgi:hypothetical protein
MQTPFELSDKMEVSLFEKSDYFYITNIKEYRDGAGFPFKMIEIGRAPKVSAPKTLPSQPKKPLTLDMKRMALKGAEPARPQIAANSQKLPAGNIQPKSVVSNNAKQVSANNAKQVSANSSKRISAQDAVYLPAGKKELSPDKKRLLPSGKK